MRVTLHDSDPVNFWTAVDELRQAAGLQYNPGMSGYSGHRDPTFSQADGLARVITPISDYGPFRVSLLGLHYQRDVSFDATRQSFKVPPQPVAAGRMPAPVVAIPTPTEPVEHVQFSARMLVAAEPRLAINQNGPLQILEAVDNRGNSLVPVTGSGRAFNGEAGYFGVSSARSFKFRPSCSAGVGRRHDKKLRGLIRLAICSRKPDPLVIPLHNGASKTVENADVQITVHDLRPQPSNSRNMLVDLSVKSNDPGAAEVSNVAGFSNVLLRTDPQLLHIEIVDSQGRLIPWVPSGAEPETSRVTLTLTGLAHTTQPKELVTIALTQGSVSVPFEFKDLPMP